MEELKSKLSIILLSAMVLAACGRHGVAATAAKIRVQKCQEQSLAKSQCLVLEKMAALCDAGTPFCGRGKVSSHRTFFCEVDAPFHGSNESSSSVRSRCRDSERQHFLCPDGSLAINGLTALPDTCNMVGMRNGKDISQGPDVHVFKPF